MKGMFQAFDTPPGRATIGTSVYDPKARFNSGFWAGALSESKRSGSYRIEPPRSTMHEDPFWFYGYQSGGLYQANGRITAAGSHPAWQEFLLDLRDPELINLLDIGGQ